MPQLIYINDTYCATFEQLKSLLADDRNQKESGFRKEILSYYRDGILQEWLEALGKNEVNLSLTENTDNETFKSIVKAVTGQEIKGDILSKFNEVGEFLRLEYDGKTYEKSNETIKITNFKAKTIKFIFRCLKPENNEFVFSFGEQTKSMIWNDYTRSQEVAMEFDVEKEGVYQLKEGKVNTLSAIEINTYKTIDLGLSVYWADRNIGAEKPEDEGICDITKEEAKRKITEQFGKGWRLPSIKEMGNLSNLRKENSKVLYGALFAIKEFNNVTDNNDVITISSNNDTITLPKAGLYMTNEENDYFSYTKKGIVHTWSPYKVYIRPVLDKK